MKGQTQLLQDPHAHIPINSISEIKAYLGIGHVKSRGQNRVNVFAMLLLLLVYHVIPGTTLCLWRT